MNYIKKILLLTTLSINRSLKISGYPRMDSFLFEELKHQFFDVNTSSSCAHRGKYVFQLRLKSFRICFYHRYDGPSIISYYPSGQIKKMQWYLYGLKHRQYGPAYIKYFPNSVAKEEKWYRNGKKHRYNLPARTLYSESETIKKLYYFEYGLLHRIGGPAKIVTKKSTNDNVYRQETWFIHGALIFACNIPKKTKTIFLNSIKEDFSCEY